LSCVKVNNASTLTSGQSRCFLWHVPEGLTAGTCDLDLYGEDADGGYIFQESHTVEVVDNYHITFIQSDKPIYKPGDTGVLVYL